MPARSELARRWWDGFRVARRTAIGAAILGLFVVVCVFAAVRRASSIVNRLLREWAAGSIAEQSGEVYQLELGDVRFDWALRRVAVDSINLTTRRAVNARRPHPLAGLRLALYGCTISGVHFISLVRSAGLLASSFGCRSGSLIVEVPRRVPDRGSGSQIGAPAGNAFGERQAFLVVQQAVRLPSYAPRVQIDQVLFPRLAVDVRLPRTANGVIRFQLERLQWSMAGVVIDPTDITAASRPLFSRTIELVANNFVTHPRPSTAVRVGLLRSSLTDSTLEIRNVGVDPTAGGAEPTKSPRYRRDIITLTVGRVAAQGIDFGAFIVGQGIRARRIEVDSVRLEVSRDNGLPRDPHRSSYRTPQQWIADLDETLSLDSLRVRNGEVVYREHAADRVNVGVFTIARIEAAATNVTHFVGRRTSEDPMTLTARAHLENVGQLDVRAVVPLDAPGFNLDFRGTLGAMPAEALNSFVVETDALQIESGQVSGVDFGVAVRKGVAVGTITPVFTNLAVSVTRGGSGGILGSGGVLGGAARHVASFAAKFKLRSDNPDAPAKAPRIGTIRQRFSSDQTLIAFLWSSIRDGLLSVVRR